MYQKRLVFTTHDGAADGDINQSLALCIRFNVTITRQYEVQCRFTLDMRRNFAVGGSWRKEERRGWVMF
jgi:hypothetical protein